MKSLIQLLLLGALVWIVALAHPFGLAMPWQGGSPTPVNDAVLEIMESHDFEFISLDWGRVTPLNFVASDGVFTSGGRVSTTCTEVRASLARWGSVTDTNRLPDGCEIEADSFGGTMHASVKIAEDETLGANLRIDLRVQHTE